MSKRFVIWGLCVFAVAAFASVAVADVPQGNHDAINMIDDLVSRAAPAPSEAVRIDPSVGDMSQAGTSDAGCQNLAETCNIPFYIWSVPGTANSRIAMGQGYEAAGGVTPTPCSVKTVNVVIYDWIDTLIKKDVQVAIHADDGAGLPGAVISSKLIPVATVDANLFVLGGGFIPVDFSGDNIVIPPSTRFHVVVDVPGAVNGTDGVFLLSDGGTDDAGACPEGAANTRGSVFYTGVGFWETDATHFGGFQFGRIWNVDVCCEAPPPDCFNLAATCNIPFYIWSVPGTANSRIAMGQSYQLDPTGSRVCTLKTFNIVIYDWIDTLIQEDVLVEVHDDDGAGLPGTVIGSATIPAATVQANLFVLGGGFIPVDFSAQNLTVPAGALMHITVSVPTATPGTSGVFLLSDGGTDDAGACPEGAGNTGGSVFYTGVGFWESDATHFGGFQFGRIWNIDVCCPALQFLLCTPAADADWETQGNGIGRPNATTASISNTCALQTAWSAEITGLCKSLQPIIAGDQVFTTGTDAVYAFDKATGTLNWTNGTFPLLLGETKGGLTAADTGVYAAGGTARSFTKYDAVTGAVLWSRNATTVPLDDPNGQLNWTGSIVLDGFVYFTQETGNVYKLDAGTGATAGFLALPDAPTALPYNAMCSDGVKLWVGTMDPAQASAGSIFQIDMATMTIDWQLTNPSATFTGDPVNYTFDGFLTGLAYEGGILYYNSLMPPDADAFPNTGAVGAIDVATEDGTGAGILWVNDVNNAPMSSPGFSPTSSITLGGAPAIGPGFIYTASYGRWGGTTEPDGLAAWSKTLGSRIWYVGYGNLGNSGGVPVSDDVRSDNPPTVICQPDGTPYLFTGHVDGTHRFSNGNTGDREWYRTLTGRVRSTAVGEDCVAFTVRNGDPATGGGSIVVYTVQADRARLQLDSQFVFRTATPGDGAVNDLVTDAFQNTGCIDLNVASYTVVNPPAVRVTSVNPNLAAVGRAAARNLGGYDRFLDMMSDKDMAIAKSVGALEEEVEENLARTFASASAAADPVFLTVNTAAGAVAAGAAQTLDVTYDETGLTNNTGYINYIEIASDDPDYFPQGAVDFTGGVTTPGVPYIEFNLFIGCPDASDLMTIGLGTAWITNWGAEGGGGNFATPDSEDGFIWNGHDWMFDGGWAMVLQDSVHWAFEGCSVGGYPRRAGEWGPTLPCGVTINSASYDSPLGVGADAVEEVTFNMIDLASTNGFFTPSTRQMGGVFLEVKRVGAADAAFGDFVVTEVKITNEVGDPGDIVGDMNDIYFGLEIDWDIAAGTDNFVYVNAAGYAAHDGGVADGSAAGYITGHSRLDAPIYGAGALGSGAAPTFMMGDIMNDQGRGNRAFDILSDPVNYGNSVDPASTANTDIGAIMTAINIPTLADGATETVYMAVYGVANGENGLAWSDAAGFEAAVSEVQCRAAAFAGFGKGDVTCDGVIDLQDVVALGNIIDGLLDPTGTGGVYTADVNADNVWDQADYDLLYDVVAGVQPASALANGWRF